MLTDALKRLARHSLVYAAGPAVQKLIGFALLPFVTAWIGSRGNYGVVELSAVTLAVAAQVLGINLLQGLTRYYQGCESEAERGRLVGTCVLLLLGTTSAALGLAFVFRVRGAELLFGSGEYADALVLTAGILVAQTLSQVGLRWLQILERSITYGVVTTTKLLLEVGLKVWFLAGLGLTYMGVLWSVLVGELVVAAGVGVMLVARTRLGFSRAMAERLWRYSGPLLLSGLCGFVLHQGDRFFVLGNGGRDDVGVYALCYKLGSIGNAVVFEAFALIWFPFVFAIKDQDALRRLVRAVMVYFLLVMAVVSLGIALFSPELVRLMADPQFFDAHRGLPLVAAGYFAWCAYQVASTVFFVRERTWIVSALVAGAAAVNLAANALLVPAMGWMGAAWATLLTFIVLAIAAWIVAERVWCVGHELGRVLVPPALGAALYAACVWLAPANAVASLVLRACAVLALPGILWICGYLKTEEEHKLRALVRKGLSAAFDRR